MVATLPKHLQQKPHATMTKAPSRRGITAILNEPETVTPWVCQGLHWAPGRPAMVIGYPGAGKSYAAVSAVVALVFNRAVWGAPHLTAARPLRALYVDMDMGRVLAEKRLRRIVVGMGLTAADVTFASDVLAQHRNAHPDDVGEVLECQHDTAPLRLASLAPDDVAAFRAAWTAAARGFDIVLIDPLRSMSTIEENASTAEVVPRTLRDVSDATGAMFIVVHHAGKSGERSAGRGRGRPVHEAGRGSSAIDAAAGAIVLIDKTSDGRRRVQMTRDGADPDGEPFAMGYMTLDKIATEHGAGIVQRYEVAAEDEPTGGPRKERTNGSVVDAIVKATLAHADGIAGSNAMVAITKRRKTDILIGLRTALEAGVIHNGGTPARPIYVHGPAK